VLWFVIVLPYLKEGQGALGERAGGFRSAKIK